MPLPTREDVLEVLFQHPAGLDVEAVAAALRLQSASHAALLRLLDNWVYEGVLEARTGDRFVPSRRFGGAAPAPPKRAAEALLPSEVRAKKSKKAEKKAKKAKKEQREREALAHAKKKRTAAGSTVPSGFNSSTAAHGGQTGEGKKVATATIAAETIAIATEMLPPPRKGERDGVVTVNPRGFGFVASPQHPNQDVFVAEDRLGGAMHGDTVRVRITGYSSRGADGEIIQVLLRAKSRVGGILRRRGKSAWVEPDDSRLRGRVLLTSEQDLRGSEGNSGVDGDVVVVEITQFPSSAGEEPEGRLLAVLGRPGELGAEVRKSLLVAGIDELHSAEAIAEAEAYGQHVPAEMLQKRVDLTYLPLPTIDPEDARDHDDAVWVTRSSSGGYVAHIAIADVSSYVRPGTRLDDEARERGCSVYLPDRAIPMLPRALSSNLCSLLPDQLRLCLCVIAELDAGGKVRDYRVVRGFMRSQAKLTYGGVARALGLSDKPEKQPEAEAMKGELRVAYELSRLLRARRMKRGSLDFELPEPRIVFDEAHQPVTVQARGTDPGMKQAYQLIEELMLLGNELLAEFLLREELPGIFRVHLPPDEAKLERLASMCELLGVEFDAEEAQDPRSLGALLKRLAAHPKKSILHGLLLRSMKQAAYDVNNLGHFGLASDRYLHFTSPIRRYPDVVVHRVVHQKLQNQPIDRSDDGVRKMAEAAALASSRERRAMEVEREIADLYKCVIMQQHLGERFEGTVSAIVGSGVYVSLSDPFVDVLVRFEDLGHEPFSASEDGLRVYGKRSGFSLMLGDPLQVEILETSMHRRAVFARRVAQLHDVDDGLEVDEGADARPRRRPQRASRGERFGYTVEGAPHSAAKPKRFVSKVAGKRAGNQSSKKRRK